MAHKVINLFRFKKASTLVKMLIINGVLAIILGAIVIAINPAKQIAQTNNAKRNANVISILNAIYQYSADNGGSMPLQIINRGGYGKISRDDIDLCSTLVPKYLPSLPSDPLVPKNENIINCTDTYNTGYTIALNSSTNRITVTAPNTQLPLTSPISVSR